MRVLCGVVLSWWNTILFNTTSVVEILWNLVSGVHLNLPPKLDLNSRLWMHHELQILISCLNLTPLFALFVFLSADWQVVRSQSTLQHQFWREI
jgi:hypothetical protein